MNYTLQIDLVGADKADAALDRLLKKVGQMSASPKISFDEWLGLGAGGESHGEKMGENVGKGFSKKFKQYGMADLSKLFSKSGFASPSAPDFLSNKGFFDKKSIDKMQLLSAGIATLFNPFVGARMLSDIIPKGGGGSGGGGGMAGAIFGAAGAAGYTEIFVVVKLLQTAFKALVSAIKNTVQAYEDARKIYAKSLTSGLGLNFTVKRGMMAEVLGVSETEVIRFGSAWNYLNQRLEFASSQLAKTATPLAGVGFESKIAHENIRALWSQMALGLAPAIKSLVSEFNDFMVTLGKSQVIEAFGIILKGVVQTIVNAIGVWEIAVTSITTGMKLIADAFALAITYIINMAHKLPGVGKFLPTFDTGVIEKDAREVGSAWLEEVKNFSKNIRGASLNDTPPPQAWMKQLGASTWEKMGLVIAGGSGNTTNDLIRKSNGLLKQLVDVSKGYGVPRAGQFGLSPQVNNP